MPEPLRSDRFGEIRAFVNEALKSGLTAPVETLRPTGRAKAKRRTARPKLNMEQEVEQFRRAVDATFAIQDRFAKDWTHGPGTAGMPEVVARIRAIAFDQGLSLEELKTNYQLTATELGRFAVCMGVSPWQYVVETRMEVTARLLAESPMTLERIAWAVGYAEPRQLRRAFQKWSNGLTPAKYRRQAREVTRRMDTPPTDLMHWKVLEVTARPEKHLAEARDLARYLETLYWPAF